MPHLSKRVGGLVWPAIKVRYYMPLPVTVHAANSIIPDCRLGGFCQSAVGRRLLADAQSHTETDTPLA
jgi:hypothetical protein